MALFPQTPKLTQSTQSKTIASTQRAEQLSFDESHKNEIADQALELAANQRRLLATDPLQRLPRPPVPLRRRLRPARKTPLLDAQHLRARRGVGLVVGKAAACLKGGGPSGRLESVGYSDGNQSRYEWSRLPS